MFRIKNSRSNVCMLLSAVALALSIFELSAQTLTVTVTDDSGDPVQNAVVAAYGKSNRATTSTNVPKTAIVDQVDKEFVEHVTPVQLGTAVKFPNYDNIRHHVYSFSPTKPFEIPLYKGMPAEPVVFDKAGVVALGCNIHDWMSAYVYVVDTPHFLVTDDAGMTALKLPAGRYQIQIWHPKLEDQDTVIERTVEVSGTEASDIAIQTALKQDWMPRRGPLSILSRGRYR